MICNQSVSLEICLESIFCYPSVICINFLLLTQIVSSHVKKRFPNAEKLSCLDTKDKSKLIENRTSDYGKRAPEK